MPSILDENRDSAKIMLIGKSGAGKTGSLASLVASGFNLRIIDSDKGVRPLYSLLTDQRYPYAKIIAQQKIDLNFAVRYVPIDLSLKLRTITLKSPNGNTRSETLLAPTDAKAWGQVLTLFDHWREPDGFDLGPISKWTNNEILVIDSFSTLAKAVYYFSQSINGRLGARDEGFDYQRDVGQAQSQLTRLLELLHASSIPCNVVIISHITWVDDSSGTAQRPNASPESISAPDGYPSAIGRALSPQIGKYFNDVYIVRSSGSGENVRRTVSTVPQDGVIAKTSVYLEREYPISYGMAKIFSHLLPKPLPPGFIDHFTTQKQTKPQIPTSGSSSISRSNSDQKPVTGSVA